MKKYDFDAIEKKWQKKWEEDDLYTVTEDKAKKKFYCLEMLPYPSGRLHMGHTRNYAIGDAICRFKRMNGYNVLHPIGFDAFGLPAENAAIENKSNPATWTLQNIEAMRLQFKRLGVSYDWNREVITCLPEYYRWNQWFFLKMLEKGLAYRQEAHQNWCEKCNTVLANEQVVNGNCWRHTDTPVIQKKLQQWYFRYSDFAEELLQDLDHLSQWPERVITMQRNWIGKSEGSNVDFPLKNSKKTITVFTTRIDTIYGATFMVLSPDHPILEEIVKDTEKRKEIERFRAEVRDEMAKKTYGEELEKKGLDTGLSAINPFTEEEIPIWVSNFVLMDYGTGAVMSVPAHDQRDYEFAVKYNLNIRKVIIPKDGDSEPEEGKAYEAKGILIDSGPFSNKTSEEAIELMNRHAEEYKIGSAATDYRLKDWCLSRQRFWGTPIPVIYCEKCGAVPVPEEELPVILPDVDLDTGHGSPLVGVDEFVKTDCPKCGLSARRETDTMDTFVDSSWYMLRYTDAKINNSMLNKDATRYWLPVDIYIGGIEHAVGHLMYFRYFYNRLRDLGLVKDTPPVIRLFTQGMVYKDGHKMSKSKGNVVDPNDMIERYGADTTRMFSLFGAPPEKDLEWSEAGVEGIFRFLNRVWNLVNTNLEEISNIDLPEDDWKLDDNSKKLRRKTHQTIKRVTRDVEQRLHFNTAISAIMELVNEAASFKANNKVSKSVLKEAIYNVAVLLAIFAPHLSEELYHAMGYKETIVDHPWPEWSEKIAAEERITVAIQVNGKLRGQIEVDVDATDESVLAEAAEERKVAKYLENMEVVKKVYVKGRLVNFVVR